MMKPKEIETIKKRTQEHWSRVPIGTQTSGFRSDHKEFTKEYFADHSNFRFNTYSPWLRDVAQFDAFEKLKVVEVGCGMGTDLLEYAKGGAIVTGLDLTPRHVELARKRFRLYNQSGTFVIGDAEELCFKDNSFDFAYSNGVLHHTPRTEQAVKEMHRVLKPGGRALIILYHRNSLHYYLHIRVVSASKRFIRHLISGRKLGEFSMRKVLAETTDGESNPLTKLYSRMGGKQMMQTFRTVKTEVYHLNKGDFPLGFLVPKPVLQFLSRYVGWYLVLRGVK